MDVHEVTVGRFRAWWDAGHAPPSTSVPLFVAGDGTSISWDATWTIHEPTRKSKWESAASGHASRLYPWSLPRSSSTPAVAADLDCRHAVSSVGTTACPFPTTRTTMGTSVDGAYDLAGSVAEWVLDVAPPGDVTCKSGCYPTGPLVDPIAWSVSATLHGVRGGHFQDTDPGALRASARAFADASIPRATIGIRCVHR
jgi:formylglycine-generating enzyme required for sulfatase activity